MNLTGVSIPLKTHGFYRILSNDLSMRSTVLIFIAAVTGLSLFSCKDNSFGLQGLPAEEEIPGIWSPLAEGDTISVYIRNGDKIHYSDSRYDFTELPLPDTTYFEVWTHSNYARDTSFVYYPIETDCVVPDTNYVCYCTNYVIEGANPITFRYLGQGYGTDGETLYRNGKIVEGFNGETF